jgi:hypothetical protein
MLITRISKRLWLVFPVEGSPERYYMFYQELKNTPSDEARPLIEAQVHRLMASWS